MNSDLVAFEVLVSVKDYSSQAQFKCDNRPENIGCQYFGDRQAMVGVASVASVASVTSIDVEGNDGDGLRSRVAAVGADEGDGLRSAVASWLDMDGAKSVISLESEHELLVMNDNELWRFYSRAWWQVSRVDNLAAIVSVKHVETERPMPFMVVQK